MYWYIRVAACLSFKIDADLSFKIDADNSVYSGIVLTAQPYTRILSITNIREIWLIPGVCRLHRTICCSVYRIPYNNNNNVRLVMTGKATACICIRLGTCMQSFGKCLDNTLLMLPSASISI